ncbi:hypothetical protein COCMIDRAFT_9980 [Bipolaris oryzae ATCC 44560]|uniref:Uncharacterized protein n=1 Tax=Bipolaris oryzae ATCC 44560 TaxID=930090 RepID=W6YLH1_COCMI|nr:uncharacterized protein COCMIDRAFT_9980 [Bipolaris oryzae ATCC 44560]EUC40062.1 hypothetical protein COCMIDRAFT_9980 [Bipolaris oryzae ATCC 44560]
MTIDFMADLANVVEIQGKLEEAETMRSRMREALEIREAREAREFMAEEETREARDIIDAQEAQVAQEATAMPKGLSTKVRNMSHRFVSESDLEDVIFESRRRTAGLAE